MVHLDLFSGIGGFALAVDWVWPNSEHIFCDNDKFCQAVLKKHWPTSKIYDDIRKITDERLATDTIGDEHRPERSKIREAKKVSRVGGETLDTWRFGRTGSAPAIDILTGGFPCQPFSQAGKRRGTADDRYLWPEMLRVIKLTQPTWVIAENVRGLLTQEQGLVFEQVCTDLERAGYEVQPLIIPAVAVNAPHRRDRVWIVANRTSRGERSSQSERGESRQPKVSLGSVNRDATDTTGERLRGDSTREKSLNATPRAQQWLGEESWSRDWKEVAFATCYDRVDDGLPKRLVRLPDGTTITESRWRKEALKGYGNAIVPQVAEQIMRAISMSDEYPSILSP